MKYLILLPFFLSLSLFAPKVLGAASCHEIFQSANVPPDLNASATELVSNLEKKHDKFFLKEGFKKNHTLETFNTHPEFVFKLKESNAEIPQLLAKIQGPDLAFAMARKSRRRLQIEKNGFINQFVANTSGGHLDHTGRNALEATCTGLNYEDYKGLDNDLKPKYGMLMPDPQSDVRSEFSSRLSQYGDDIYFFKKKALESKTTFTVGDSMNLNLANNRWYYGDDATYEPWAWDQLFTPWSRNAVIAPFIAKEMESNNRLKISKQSSIATSQTSDEYIELQFWGPVNLNDVSSFAFTEFPPEGEFLTALKKLKIIIYDFRDKTNYIEWR